MQPRSSALEHPSIGLVRTARGWQVTSPAGTHAVDSLVEGLSLADLIAEEHGERAEPDRSSRRSARGPRPSSDEAADPIESRVAALERTVAQLEHALAARVATERAIGVLAERAGIDPRAAFETLRHEARSSGRAVADVARDVLGSLVVRAGAAPLPAATVPPAPRAPEPSRPFAADGRS